MTVSEFRAGPYKDLLERADKIMWEKMGDYARSSSALHNFRRSAEAYGLTPFQVWGIFADKHWGAISRFIRDGQVESESILDRMSDLINYLTLLAGLIADEDVKAYRQPKTTVGNQRSVIRKGI